MEGIDDFGLGMVGVLYGLKKSRGGMCLGIKDVKM